MKVSFFIRYNADKYQRLGLLKILVALLDPQRRSVSSESINQKLLSMLFAKAENGLTMAEHLIRKSTCSSWNFRFTKETVKQILDWGQLNGFVGSGNQITERGLLLRHLMGEDAIAAIRSSLFNINPFTISREEKIYFLFRQHEIDAPLYFVIKKIAGSRATEVISGINADKLTCLAFYDAYQYLSAFKQYSGGLLAMKNMREMIGRMSRELGLEAEIPIAPAIRPVSSTKLRAKEEQRNKKRTKTADHEAITRFEFLVDIGLLDKIVDSDGNRTEEEYRKMWRYRVNSALYAFADRLNAQLSPDFVVTEFAHTAAALIEAPTEYLSAEKTPVLVALQAYDAYKIVKRVFGHTPLESIAIVAMIKSLAAGKVLELNEVHKLFLEMKRIPAFSESVKYAAGNELDRMFVELKPSFTEEVQEYYGK